jgi:hypothetical protein
MKSLSAFERPGNVVATTNMTYTPRGDVASITDADGITLRFEYDGATMARTCA